MPKSEVTNITVALKEPERDNLMRLATKHGCFAITGKTAGEPSVRRLIVELGQGKFSISSKASHGARGRSAPVPQSRPAPVKAEKQAPSAPDVPLWWPRDFAGDVDGFLQLDGLPDEVVSEGRAMGLEEVDGMFLPLDHWYEAAPVLEVPAAEPAEDTSQIDGNEGTCSNCSKGAFHDGTCTYCRDPKEPLQPRPDWWPDRPVSRGDLADLLNIHEGIGQGEIDQWLALQGEWNMDGSMFVTASAWEGAAE